jgi:hypothetical protein
MIVSILRHFQSDRLFANIISLQRERSEESETKCFLHYITIPVPRNPSSVLFHVNTSSTTASKTAAVLEIHYHQSNREKVVVESKLEHAPTV